MSVGELVVDGLTVAFGRGAARREAIRDLSLVLSPGRATALVGESGSGKSVTARTLVGLAGAGASVTARRLRLGTIDLLALDERGWRGLRGRGIGFVLQDALVSLDPLRPVGREIAEALRVHGWGDRASRERRVLALLERVGVPEPAFRARQRPDELSGGLRQRALIASAIALDPGLVIADEPTTALDAAVAGQVLSVLRSVKEDGRGLLLITHDLAAASRLADEIVVLREGRVVEQGPVRAVLGAPTAIYTRRLLDAVPGTHPRGTRLSAERCGHAAARAALPLGAAPILTASGLGKRYRGPDAVERAALHGVGLLLHPGETVGVVGASGSGKTTLARIVLGLLDPDEGEVRLDDTAWAGAGAAAVAERGRRGRRSALGMIPQDPLSSFDPRWPVRRLLSDALERAGVARGDRAARIKALLDEVRLAPTTAQRWPREMSGGQRQRVAIARAISGRPRIIVCDEPVSALDASVQAEVLDLLADLQATLGLACLFISHDLGVIRHVSDTVLVMSEGTVVEAGPTERVFRHPEHPFTRRLIEAAAMLGEHAK